MNRFYRQTVGDFQVALDLNYTIFDFGARSGRIDSASARALASNFAFNDTHRNVIYAVEEAYYQLLAASGQEEAARASLSNTQTVQQAAEARLNSGLATLLTYSKPGATAQAEYELQAVLGNEEIARGNLATALGASPTSAIRVQPLGELQIPEAIDDTVERRSDRALAHRPDLLEQVAQVRAANGTVKEARAAFYPSLTFSGGPIAQSLYGLQQQFPWGHTAGTSRWVGLNLNWVGIRWRCAKKQAG